MPDPVYLKQSANTAHLGKSLGMGGAEAEIFEVEDNPNLVVKVFNDDSWNADAVRHLIANPIVASRTGYEFVSPLDLALNARDGEAIGFVMKRVRDAVDLKLIYQASPWLPQNFLLRVALHITHALADCHRSGRLRRDFDNVMASSDGKTFEIDMDSMDVGGHRSLPVKPEYLAPELLSEFLDNGSVEDAEVTVESDLWGHCSELFKLLLGRHPFTGQYLGSADRVPAREKRILHGWFPYAGTHGEFGPPSDGPAFRDLHLSLRQLFIQCFVDGHSEPKCRPPLERWIEVLSAMDAGHADVQLTPEAWRAVETGSRAPDGPLLVSDVGTAQVAADDKPASTPKRKVSNKKIAGGIAAVTIPFLLGTFLTSAGRNAVPTHSQLIEPSTLR